MTRTNDRPPSEQAACNDQLLGERLTYQAPGWAVAAPNYDVVCWAPGEITNDGRPTGKRRSKWMLWVEVGQRQGQGADVDREDRPSSSFMIGASLGQVVQALGLLPDTDRGPVLEALFRNLIGPRP